MSIVRHIKDLVPKPSQEDWDRVANIKEEDIDTSDIPEITDFSKFYMAKDRSIYKPIKNTISINLDADVLEYFISQGKGYQTYINEVLRKEMLSHQNK